MVRTGVAVLAAVTVVVLAAALAHVLQQQRQQGEELARLRQCVSILERNQSTPQPGLVMGCPLYG